MCAAPGTKTMHLAELMQNTGTLIATDVNEQRLLLVNESSTRLGVDIVQTQPIAADGHDLPAGPFDAILLDVPCSNTGVLGKRVDARWRITADDLVELPQIQRRLLEAAYGRLAPRGRILYSTCSIEVEENRSLIDAFLAAHPDLTKADEAEFVPGRPADGGYQALLVHGDM